MIELDLSLSTDEQVEAVGTTLFLAYKAGKKDWRLTFAALGHKVVDHPGGLVVQPKTGDEPAGTINLEIDSQTLSNIVYLVASGDETWPDTVAVRLIIEDWKDLPEELEKPAGRNVVAIVSAGLPDQPIWAVAGNFPEMPRHVTHITDRPEDEIREAYGLPGRYLTVIRPEYRFEEVARAVKSRKRGFVVVENWQKVDMGTDDPARALGKWEEQLGTFIDQAGTKLVIVTTKDDHPLLPRAIVAKDRPTIIVSELMTEVVPTDGGQSAPMDARRKPRPMPRMPKQEEKAVGDILDLIDKTARENGMKQGDSRKKKE